MNDSKTKENDLIVNYLENNMLSSKFTNQYNIGYYCATYPCEQGLANKLAVRFLSPILTIKDMTFQELDNSTNQFANILLKLGFKPEDVLFTYLPKCPEQLISFLGTLKAGLIAGTLFSNFGTEALLDRLSDAQAKVIVTKRKLLKRFSSILGELPALRAIILIDIDEHESEQILSYNKLKSEASLRFTTPVTPPSAPSVLHYTSGSTGKPKGVLHHHESLLSQTLTSEKILQLNPQEVYWCTADPGWVTGISYGIIGPCALGVSQIHFEGGYHAETWMRIINEQCITIWYTAPTALRMLMNEDPEIFKAIPQSKLKHIFSVGEPLNPEIVHWGHRVLHRDIHDTYFQTETGAIMISNRPSLTIKPGSMGVPVPDIAAAIIDDAGHPLQPNQSGALAIKAPWPSMFTTYLNHDEIYKSKFIGSYYLTGDRAYQDMDGYFWFVGRNDDIINTAGHLISPFEIESALLEIPEIAESAAIGASDDMLFEKVVAFIKLNEGVLYSRELELKIRLFVSNRVSTIATPQDIRFVDTIPKNKSGKIMRRYLKALYTGADPGDISTMED